MSTRSYQRYPLEFKQSSAQLAVKSGRPLAQTARELGVTGKTLQNWVDHYSAPKDPSKQQNHCHNAEIQRLRKQLAVVTEERDLLKKAAAYFAKTSV
jgi:transposase